MRILLIITLVFSSLALFYASANRLVLPNQAVFLRPAIESEEKLPEWNTDLINEIRGVGGVLFIGGLMALLALFNSKLRPISIQICTVIFGGIVLGRLISFSLDGIPSPALIKVSAVEIIFCILNILCLAKMYLRK